MIGRKNAKKIYSALKTLYSSLEKVNFLIDDILHNPKKKRLSKKPQRYIHIGYPKSASTAIQKGYLGRHNQLLHLGCGSQVKNNFWDDLGYIDRKINKAVEVDLRFKNNFAYDYDSIKRDFQKYFDLALEDPNIHAVGISNENFCFNWHGGIDVTEKAKRLVEIFGEGTNIVVVLRRQKSLIESLYKENIRFGYEGKFDDFLKYLWIYKDRNFTYEFCFDNVIELYKRLFGEDNVHILFFEDLKLSSENFLKDFSEAIGIDYYRLDFSKRYNKQLSSKELFIKRFINKEYSHTFGRKKYTIVDNHRYIPYFKDEIDIGIPEEIHFDYEARRHFNMLSKTLADKIEMPDIKMSWNSEFGKKLLGLYNKSNKGLLDKTPQLKRKLETHNYTNQQYHE